MRPWYETSFSHDYLKLYAHRDDAEARSDVQAILRLIDPPRDRPLLDLCCGAGRHLEPLYRLGFTRLVGLDLSADLLITARRRLRAIGAQIPSQVSLVRADMRHIPYRSCFSTVLSLFTSFGYFARDEENQAVLRGVYRALKPGGWLLIDYMNREHVLRNIVAQDETWLGDWHVRNERRLGDGCRRVEKRTVVTLKTGEQRTFHESVRLYSVNEMVKMVEAAGFQEVRCYGALDGQPFNGPASPRLVLIATKPGRSTHTGGRRDA